jgi:hypothetical protein
MGRQRADDVALVERKLFHRRAKAQEALRRAESGRMASCCTKLLN